MEKHNCENCNFRAKYDHNPKSFLGRLWHWHAGWCPGWKSYMNSLTEEKRNSLAEKYDLSKFKHFVN